MKIITWYRLVLILGVFVMSSSCAQTTFNGMSVQQVFTDARVAKLAEAVSDGDFTEADKQIAAGANVNTVGADGLSPLLWVMHSTNYNAERMEYLLKKGANPNYKAHDISAMSWAAGHDSQALEILLKYKGDPNLLGPHDTPILFIAVDKFNQQSIETILHNGGNINIHNKRNDTAANIAARSGDFKMVVYFLEHGLTYNLQGLAKSVDAVVVDSSEESWKEKAIEILKSRGAKFPAFDPDNPQDPTPWDKND